MRRRLEPLKAPLFLRKGCFPVDFQEVKRPLGTKSVKRPIKVGKRAINEGKRPIKAKVLVGVSVGSLMGCFRAPLPWRKTAPLKRPIKRSMRRRQKIDVPDLAWKSQTSFYQTSATSLGNLLKQAWTFRIFFIFSARGKGEGEFEAPGGGRSVFYSKIPRGGGGLPGGRGGGSTRREGGGSRAWEGV